MDVQAFITFLSANYLIPVWAVIIFNYITGVASAGKAGIFEWKIAFKGLIGLIYAFIGYIAFAIFAFFMQGIMIYGISFTSLFLIIMTILVAYKANSMIINSVDLLGLPQLKVLEELDAKVKEIIAADQGKLFITGVEPEEVINYSEPPVDATEEPIGPEGVV